MSRRAGPDDLPEIVRRLEAFHSASMWSGHAFDPESMARSVERVLEKGAVFLTGDGIIGLVEAAPLFNEGLRVVMEMFFHAPDGRGDELRRAAEEFAGSDPIVMNAHRANPRAEAWYRRKGYAALETTFVRF